ncbi:hypothetical protein [Streptomyces sp. NPDC047028]|uniref:hypothetical protein n=1 Tax=Streptomyces sp. NPDC047028 TaxID=3155793 RepID=UPI0033DAE41E
MPPEPVRHWRELPPVAQSPVAGVRRHVESGELAAPPLPLIEALVLGPVIAVTPRWLSAGDAVDLDEVALVLPDRIWRAVAARPD